VNGAECVVVMTKSDGVGWPVWAHRIEGEHDLGAGLCPAALLGRVFFADVLGGEHGCAIRKQAERKDPPGGIGSGCVTLVRTSEISLPAGGQHRRAQGRNEQAERQQGTRDREKRTHDE
jgi:hypothetical protein